MIPEHLDPTLAGKATCNTCNKYVQLGELTVPKYEDHKDAGVGFCLKYKHETYALGGCIVWIKKKT